MKKSLWLMSLCMVVTMVCAGFVSCGSDDDDDSSSSGSQLVGLWYEYDGDYIHAYYMNANGTGWKGEWRVGDQEEHRALTWKVEGNRFLTYNAKDGDQMDDYIFEISNGGKTLTLKKSSGKVKGVFTKQ